MAVVVTTIVIVFAIFAGLVGLRGGALLVFVAFTDHGLRVSSEDAARRPERNRRKHRRIRRARDDGSVMEATSGVVGDPAADLLELYDTALPEVHAYLHYRCGGRLLAEELAAESFMAAVASIKAGKVSTVTVAWLIGIARHKLVDHWRRTEREERRLKAVAGELQEPGDDWDVVLDQHLANQVLAGLGAHHRAVLTLRYIDGLPVREVADLLDRTPGATEALLTRAKAAFRANYSEIGGLS